MICGGDKKFGKPNLINTQMITGPENRVIENLFQLLVRILVNLVVFQFSYRFDNQTKLKISLKVGTPI